MNQYIQYIGLAVSYVFGLGWIYGTFKSQIKKLDEDNRELRVRVQALSENTERIAAIESKIDILLKHFVK